MQGTSARNAQTSTGYTPSRYGLLLGLASLVASCSPRYTVYEVEAAGFVVEEEAWVAPDTALVVAYDFWSPSGEPFVSLLNPGRDTVYLDLARSEFMTEAFGRVSLLDVLGGGPDAGRRDVRAAYPEIALTESEAQPQLILPPEVWISFYGLPTVTSRAIDWRTDRREANAVTLDYVWSRAGALERCRHEFGLTTVERLRRRDYRRYGATLAQPDRFFVDRGPARRQQTLQIALEVGTAVLFAL